LALEFLFPFIVRVRELRLSPQHAATCKLRVQTDSARSKRCSEHNQLLIACVSQSPSGSTCSDGRRIIRDINTQNLTNLNRNTSINLTTTTKKKNSIRVAILVGQFDNATRQLRPPLTFECAGQGGVCGRKGNGKGQMESNGLVLAQTKHTAGRCGGGRGSILALGARILCSQRS
jgi:hypothetical protein